jgi:hypothetical protein
MLTINSSIWLFTTANLLDAIFYFVLMPYYVTDVFQIQSGIEAWMWQVDTWIVSNKTDISEIFSKCHFNHPFPFPQIKNIDCYK